MSDASSGLNSNTIAYALASILGLTVFLGATILALCLSSLYLRYQIQQLRRQRGSAQNRRILVMTTSDPQDGIPIGGGLDAEIEKLEKLLRGTGFGDAFRTLGWAVKEVGARLVVVPAMGVVWGVRERVGMVGGLVRERMGREKRGARKGKDGGECEIGAGSAGMELR